MIRAIFVGCVHRFILTRESLLSSWSREDTLLMEFGFGW